MVSPRQAEGGGDAGGGKDCQERLGAPVGGGRPGANGGDRGGVWIIPNTF